MRGQKIDPKQGGSETGGESALRLPSAGEALEGEFVVA